MKNSKTGGSGGAGYPGGPPKASARLSQNLRNVMKKQDKFLKTFILTDDPV
jgi:hypothetical protein